MVRIVWGWGSRMQKARKKELCELQGGWYHIEVFRKTKLVQWARS
jgi:hypothetical protein